MDISDHPAFPSEPAAVLHLDYEVVGFPETARTRRRAASAPTPEEFGIQFKIPRRAAGHRGPHSTCASPSNAGPSRAGTSRTPTNL